MVFNFKNIIFHNNKIIIMIIYIKKETLNQELNSTKFELSTKIIQEENLVNI